MRPLLAGHTAPEALLPGWNPCGTSKEAGHKSRQAPRPPLDVACRCRLPSVGFSSALDREGGAFPGAVRAAEPPRLVSSLKEPSHCTTMPRLSFFFSSSPAGVRNSAPRRFQSFFLTLHPSHVHVGAHLLRLQPLRMSRGSTDPDCRVTPRVPKGGIRIKESRRAPNEGGKHSKRESERACATAISLLCDTQTPRPPGRSASTNLNR